MTVKCSSKENVTKILCLVFLLSACAIGSSGCASLTVGALQKISVTSNPTAAEVTIDSGSKEITPCELNLKRKRNHIITVSKEGFKTTKVILKRSMNKETSANILIGGALGSGIDDLTGAKYSFASNSVHIDLEKGNKKEIVILNVSKK